MKKLIVLISMCMIIPVSNQLKADEIRCVSDSNGMECCTYTIEAEMRDNGGCAGSGDECIVTRDDGCFRKRWAR